VNLDTSAGNERGLELEFGIHIGGHTERLLRLCEFVILRIEPVTADTHFEEGSNAAVGPGEIAYDAEETFVSMAGKGEGSTLSGERYVGVVHAPTEQFLDGEMRGKVLSGPDADQAPFLKSRRGRRGSLL